MKSRRKKNTGTLYTVRPGQVLAGICLLLLAYSFFKVVGTIGQYFINLPALIASLLALIFVSGPVDDGTGKRLSLVGMITLTSFCVWVALS